MFQARRLKGTWRLAEAPTDGATKLEEGVAVQAGAPERDSDAAEVVAWKASQGETSF